MHIVESALSDTGEDELTRCRRLRRRWIAQAVHGGEEGRDTAASAAALLVREVFGAPVERR